MEYVRNGSSVCAPGPGAGLLEALQLPPIWSCNHLHFWSATSSVSIMQQSLIVVLMVESPEAFRKYDEVSDRYIHRFTEMRADSGLTYPSKAKMIYVQLDKCLKQFREGKNAEAEDGTPDELQRWLAMIADANDEKVRDAAKDDETMRRMQKEMSDMVQDKEVRNMLMQEKYDRMDWYSYGDEKKTEGWAEGRAEGCDDTNVKNIRNLMDSFKLTAKQAMDALKIDVKDQTKYARQL